MNRLPAPRSSLQNILAVAAALFLVGLTFVQLGRMDGSLDKKDLLDFIEAIIVSVSFGIALALAVLAINAFKNFREIESFKEEADQLRDDLSEKMINVDKMLGALPAAIETISARLSELAPPEEGERDLSYFRLLHVRLFLKLLTATDAVSKIDICRDIIGSMSPDDSEEILDQTMAVLNELRTECPEERDLIDPLLKTGSSVATERRARRLPQEAIPQAFPVEQS